jgi:hypothetical protein
MAGCRLDSYDSGSGPVVTGLATFAQNSVKTFCLSFIYLVCYVIVGSYREIVLAWEQHGLPCDRRTFRWSELGQHSLSPADGHDEINWPLPKWTWKNSYHFEIRELTILLMAPHIAYIFVASVIRPVCGSTSAILIWIEAWSFAWMIRLLEELRTKSLELKP